MPTTLRTALAELKRRRVYRVAVVYVVVGVGVLGAAEVILDPLGLEGVRPLIVVLTLLGFPLALVLAWAYELTPEGIVRDPGTAAVMEAEAGDSPEPAPAETHPDKLWTASPGDERPSVAVLPLTNMSGDPDNEFFSDGVTEDILTHLSRVKGLRVTSRTSVMRYKGTTKSAPEVARELGVDSLLEGSIRVAGGKVRVTVQLIDASADAHLWAESYDRDLEDVFAVQSEVAEAVARALQAELSAGEIEEIRARPTDDVEAYTLCLRGEEALNTWAPGDLERAVDHFEAALRLDLNYARAYAGLAMVLAITPALSARAPADFHRRVEQAATRALELDDGLALAHAARATLLWTRDYDWPERVGSHGPGDSAGATECVAVRQMQAVMFLTEERFDEAHSQAMEEVEPGQGELMLGREHAGVEPQQSGPIRGSARDPGCSAPPLPRPLPPALPQGASRFVVRRALGRRHWLRWIVRSRSTPTYRSRWPCAPDILGALDRPRGGLVRGRTRLVDWKGQVPRDRLPDGRGVHVDRRSRQGAGSLGGRSRRARLLRAVPQDRCRVTAPSAPTHASRPSSAPCGPTTGRSGSRTDRPRPRTGMSPDGADFCSRACQTRVSGTPVQSRMNPEPRGRHE